MQYEDKYLNRITSQHKIQPMYMEWLAALLEKLQDLVDLANQIDSAFDLDTAVGKNLDTIGQLVGVDRLLKFEPKYAPSALLSDEDYRLIIRARISLNQWDGTTEGIYQVWSGVFPDATIQVVDNQDMTMSIRVYGFSNPFASEYISNGYASPKPEGVGINYDFIFTIDLSSSIYIGSKVSNILSLFSLPAKKPGGDFSLYAPLNIGGAVVSVMTQFTLPSGN